MGGKGKKVIRETFCAFNWQPSLDFNYASSSPPQAYLLSITHLKQEILPLLYVKIAHGAVEILRTLHGGMGGSHLFTVVCAGVGG